MPLENPDVAYREYQTELAPGRRFSQHHLKVADGQIADVVLLPGSHVRGRLLAEQMEQARVVGATRGYYAYTGTYDGARVSVCSTGMGGPAVAIAMEELARLGANTFIRVGSAGGWQPDLRPGDIVIVTATARYGGASRWYLPLEFPAVADHAVTAALLTAADCLALGVHHGVCASRDAFYVPWDQDLRERLQRAGVLASEMEADTLFVVGSARGWRCGAALVVVSAGLAPAVSSDGRNLDADRGEMDLIRLSLTAAATLARAKLTSVPQSP